MAAASGERVAVRMDPIIHVRVTGLNCLMMVAGLPKTTEWSGMLRVTIECAAITQFFPIVKLPLGEMIEAP